MFVLCTNEHAVCISTSHMHAQISMPASRVAEPTDSPFKKKPKLEMFLFYRLLFYLCFT